MSNEMIALVVQAFGESLYMTLASTAAAYVVGLPLGMLLVATAPNGITPRPVFNRILGAAVNFLRSVPFLIMLLWLIPVTRAVTGTAIGATGMVVPLFVSATPFIARLVEGSLNEVDRGVVEAAQSMGATPMQIVCRVMLPEAVPALITGATIAITTVLGYSAMAGIVGGGGLGGVAINYGYYRYQSGTMSVMVVILVIIVQIFQAVGNAVAKKCDKRIK